MTAAAQSAPLQREAPPAHLARAWQRAESLCIKCGFCLPACPTYRATGVEASSPRGRLELMYAAAQGRLAVADMRSELWFCLGCLACETACPSGIRFRDMLDAGRCDDTAERARDGHPWLRKLLLGRVLVSPRLLRLAAWAVYGLQRSGLRWLLGGRGLLRLLAPGLARLERRAPPLAAPHAWRAAASPYLDAGHAGQDDARPVALLTGCVMDAVFGRVHTATAKVLHANGFSVHAPPAQECCGALHHHAGEEADAQALARRNIAAFEAVGDAPVVVNSAGCGAMMKNYGSLLADDPDWAQRAARFAARVQDVAEFLDGIELRPPPRTVPCKVAYDDPCHLLHAQKIREAPRRLLANVPGLELVPLAEADWCCGSAGSYSLQHPEMAAQVLARKMGHVASSGAEVIATGNPGCLLQLALGAQDAGLSLRVAHPVELLAEAYE